MATVAQQAKSKTIKFALIMAALQSVNGSLAMWQPLLEPTQYVAIATVLGVVQSMGHIWLRHLTTQPLSMK